MISDECIRCGHIIEFSDLDYIFAWRHRADHTCACDEASPESLTLRTVTDRFLEDAR